jgi:ubiquinone biosynthesis protein Coq4
MRKKFIYWLFEHSQRIYIKFKNKKPWEIKTQELLEYSNETFGYQLGEFLNKNRFELLPKVERHDAYHLLTGYGTKVEDEIALQYVCFANGKRSLYLLGVLLIGTLILPEYYKYYIKSYKLGKSCNQFHHFDYKRLLHFSLQELREGIFNKEQILQIQ